MDLNLSGFVFNAAGLLLRLDATLSIETSSTCSTWSATLLSSQNYPMYIKQRTSCFRDFPERNAVSNITISVILQEPVWHQPYSMASTVSGRGIDHYKWHRLLSGKASTVKNGIACLRKGKLRRRQVCFIYPMRLSTRNWNPIFLQDASQTKTS